MDLFLKIFKNWFEKRFGIKKLKETNSRQKKKIDILKEMVFNLQERNRDLSKKILEKKNEIENLVNQLRKLQKGRFLVDGPNLEQRLKERNLRIDFLKLLKNVSNLLDGLRLSQSIYYHLRLPEGHPSFLNQRRFYQALRKIGFKVRLKESLSPYTEEGEFFVGDIDSLINSDLQKISSSNCEILILLSGDSHFAPKLKRISEEGVKIIILGFEGHLSWELQEVADQVVFLLGWPEIFS